RPRRVLRRDGAGRTCRADPRALSRLGRFGNHRAHDLDRPDRGDGADGFARGRGAVTSRVGAESHLQAQVEALRESLQEERVKSARLAQALSEAQGQLRVALERQTATSEILKVISSSPTDVQPVFDAVAATASRLCEASDVEIFQRNDDQL